VRENNRIPGAAAGEIRFPRFRNKIPEPGLPRLAGSAPLSYFRRDQHISNFVRRCPIFRKNPGIFDESGSHRFLQKLRIV